jgi:hypothetical protein
MLSKTLTVLLVCWLIATVFFRTELKRLGKRVDEVVRVAAGVISVVLLIELVLFVLTQL